MKDHLASKIRWEGERLLLGDPDVDALAEGKRPGIIVLFTKGQAQIFGLAYPRP